MKEPAAEALKLRTCLREGEFAPIQVWFLPPGTGWCGEAPSTLRPITSPGAGHALSWTCLDQELPVPRGMALTEPQLGWRDWGCPRAPHSALHGLLPLGIIYGTLPRGEMPHFDSGPQSGLFAWEGPACCCLSSDTPIQDPRGACTEMFSFPRFPLQVGQNLSICIRGGLGPAHAHCVPSLQEARPHCL